MTEMLGMEDLTLPPSGGVKNRRVLLCASQEVAEH